MSEVGLVALPRRRAAGALLGSRGLRWDCGFALLSDDRSSQGSPRKTRATAGLRTGARWAPASTVGLKHVGGRQDLACCCVVKLLPFPGAVPRCSRAPEDWHAVFDACRGHDQERAMKWMRSKCRVFNNWGRKDGDAAVFTSRQQAAAVHGAAQGEVCPIVSDASAGSAGQARATEGFRCFCEALSNCGRTSAMGRAVRWRCLKTFTSV